MDYCPACSAPLKGNQTTCSVCGSSLVQPHLPAQTRLQQGRYTLGRVLGQGGFGITYLAIDSQAQQTIAIKELFLEGCTRQPNLEVAPTALAGSGFDEAKERFVDEARTLARFDHSGIVKVFEVFEQNNTAYMAMEFLKGETLGARIAREGRLEEHEVLRIALAAAEALEVVHGAGLLHRDLKPDNILLEGNRVVLIDFGSARAFVLGKTLSHTRLVTPGYAPLEQYGTAGKFGPYTDIYALGATLYHALLGDVPPAATDRVQHNRDLRVPKATVDPLEMAINRALEVRINRRPQTVGEFRDLLSRPMNRPVPPKPTPLPRKVPKDYSWATPLVLGLAFMIAMYLWGAVSLQRRQERSANSPAAQTGPPVSSVLQSTVFSNQPCDVVVRPDGKILVAGFLYTALANYFYLTRYTPEGMPDNTFGFNSDGSSLFGFNKDRVNACAMALKKDDKIMIAGTEPNPDNAIGPSFVLFRYTADGALDTTFGTAGKAFATFIAGPAYAKDIVVQSYGRMIVVGHAFYTDGQMNAPALAYYNSDGSLGKQAGGGKITDSKYPDSSEGHSVALQSNGRFAIASSRNGFVDIGYFNTDGYPRERFGKEGSLVTSLLADTISRPSVVFQPDDKIVVSGYLGTYPSSYPNKNFALTRYSTDGLLDTQFGKNGIVETDFGGDMDIGVSLALQSDGKIVMAGYTHEAGLDFALARYNPDGSPDTSFGKEGKVVTDFSGKDDELHAMSLQADGKIVVVGNSDNNYVLVRYNADGSLDAGFGKDGIVISR